VDVQATEVFLRYFTIMKDPRRHNVVPQFASILVMAILAVLCNSNDWDEVVERAKAHRDWLATFLALPRGIPSTDTFRRVFARINPEAFERCFISWTRSLAEVCQGRVVAVDGKTLRRSFTQSWEKQGSIHLVSAWCSHNQMTLGQVATDSKSNEITAIPTLLDLLDLKGVIVTIDAMGCQKEIAAQIVSQEADYILAVKDNQPTLHTKVQRLMQDIALSHTKGQDVQCVYQEQTEGGHGRIETRRVWVTNEVQWLGADLLGEWTGLGSLVMVQSLRRDMSDPSDKTSEEHRYFISSLKDGTVETVAQAIRQHWGVENQLHWRLDMTFRQDESRLHNGHGAQNFSRLRRIVINKLKRDPRKVSLKVKRYRCSIDRQYLLDILQQ